MWSVCEYCGKTESRSQRILFRDHHPVFFHSCVTRRDRAGLMQAHAVRILCVVSSCTCFTAVCARLYSVTETHSTLQIYTPGEGWSEGTPLPLARGGMGKAVYYEGECYVLGGEVEPSISPDPSVKISPTRTVYRVDVYSPVTDSWRLAEVPSPALNLLSAVHCGNSTTSSCLHSGSFLGVL